MGNRRLFILYPFSLIYRIITDIRNLLYNTGFLKSEIFQIPVICVGNISVGGTGKTPHTEYIVKLLLNNFRIAVLSRGYKRKSKGFLIVETGSEVIDSGDEPLQIKHKFPQIIVAVDRNRRNGIKRIVEKFPDTDVIILDDGFQHRRIKPGLSVLLTDRRRLITRDHMLPYGRLRENSSNRSRADAIIVTKTEPEITEKEMSEIRKELQSYPGQKIMFSKIKYCDPEPLFRENISQVRPFTLMEKSQRGLILVTGIANAAPLKAYLGQYFTRINHLSFPDHHFFCSRDIEKIRNAWQTMNYDQKIVITTEKDAIRLKEFINIEPEIKNAFFYLPVEVDFILNEKQVFDQIITDYVRENIRNNRVP